MRPAGPPVVLAIRATRSRDPDVQVQQAGGVHRGQDLVRPRRVGPQAGGDRHPVLAGEQAARDGRGQLHVREQDGAGSAAPGEGGRGERNRDRDAADMRQPGKLADEAGRIGLGCERLDHEVRGVGAGQELRVRRVRAPGRHHRSHRDAADEAGQYGQAQIARPSGGGRWPRKRYHASRGSAPAYPHHSALSTIAAGVRPADRPGSAATRLASTSAAAPASTIEPPGTTGSGTADS